MKLKPGICLLIVILILMLAILLASAGFRRLEAKLLPMIVAGVVFVLAAVELRRESRERKVARVTLEKEQVAVESKGLLARYLSTGAWLIGFYVAIYLIGFIISIPLFTISYLRSQGRTWSITITVAVLLTIILYGIFTPLLGVDLYPGLILKLLGW